MEIYIRPYDIGCRPESQAEELLLVDQERRYILFGATSKLVQEDTGLFKDLGTAILNIKGCKAIKYGYPNDHGLPEHPLYKYIQEDPSEYSSVLEVFNSPWSSEIVDQMNTSIKRINDPFFGAQKKTTSDKARHFLILFREQTFECIASAMIVEKYCTTYAEILSSIKEIHSSWFNED